MPPRLIVKHLNVIEYVGTRQITGFVDTLLHAFFFQAAKKDSATALSQQFPRRLMLGSRCGLYRTVTSRRCRIVTPGRNVLAPVL